MAEIDWGNVCHKYDFVPISTSQKRMAIEAVLVIPDAYEVDEKYVVKAKGAGSVFMQKDGTSLQYGSSHVFIRPKIQTRYIVYDWDAGECWGYDDRSDAERRLSFTPNARQIVEVTRE